MVKYLPNETRELASLVMPGDLPARLKDSEVKELSVSMAKLGGRAAQPPMVRGNEIVFGRNRIAASILLGLGEIEVRPVECSDVEAFLLELTENLHRRRKDNIDGMRKSWVDSLTKLIDAEVAEEEKLASKEKKPKGEKKDPGRPQSTRAKAREIIAKAEGVEAETIRASESRARVIEPAQPSEEDGLNRARERAAGHLREAREILQASLPKLIHGPDIEPAVGLIDEAIATIHAFPWAAGQAVVEEISETVATLIDEPTDVVESNPSKGEYTEAKANITAQTLPKGGIKGKAKVKIEMSDGSEFVAPDEDETIPF